VATTSLTDNLPEAEREQYEKTFPPSDLFAITATGPDAKQYLIASFHGASEGTTSGEVLKLLHQKKEALETEAPGRDVVVIAGMDANTKQGDQVRGFYDECEQNGLASCFSDKKDDVMLTLTTKKVRTMLNPQLQKAVWKKDRETKSDINPKDHVIFDKTALTLTSVDRHNQADIEGFFPDATYDSVGFFPTADFPSDHALIVATLALNGVTLQGCESPTEKFDAEEADACRNREKSEPGYIKGLLKTKKLINLAIVSCSQGHVDNGVVCPTEEQLTGGAMVSKDDLVKMIMKPGTAP